MRVLLVGGGAREHAIGRELVRARSDLVVAASNANPGLEKLALAYSRLDVTVPAPIVDLARSRKVDFAVIGPEAPLSAGVADSLRAAEIPVVGPSKAGAQIETSKSFCRELLAKHRIDVSPRFVVIHSLEEVDARVKEFPQPFVVKPIGLTSGKGVRVQGVDFQSADDGASYIKFLLAGGSADGVLLEERVEGEEFSLMAFVTDSGVYPMPIVQDYKRALEGDQGNNTGGMGSYSQRDHLLPFLSAANRDRALDAVKKTVDALKAEGIEYRGILYGGFMLTAGGPVLIEFNARFGDPEATNVLAIYEDGDFAELLHGVAVGRVDPTLLTFRLRATVTKYVVPVGYGDSPAFGSVVRVDEPKIEETGVRLLYGQVEPAGPGRVTLSRSRGIALVGEASAVHEASQRVDAALKFVTGAFHVRHDIGTKEDLARRVEHMRRLFVPGAKSSPLPLSVAQPDAPPSSAAPPDLLLSG